MKSDDYDYKAVLQEKIDTSSLYELEVNMDPPWSVTSAKQRVVVTEKGMPSDMAISMRHSKLKASEAAILAGEVQKPGWQSKNEGIHERVSFEDAIWGFDLAGGSFYKTPLRVVGVKPDSRAEKAGIRPGDKLLRINDIDTSTLSIQEAHAIIIESGIHLKIAVTAPEDEEDAYYCYEDELDTGYDSEEERRKEAEKAKKREVHAKVSSYWSLQWPWVSKRRIIYRESNCFMVPSKYEGKHRDRFTPQPMIRTQDDIVLDSIQSKTQELKETTKNNNQEEPSKDKTITNGVVPMTNGAKHEGKLTNGIESNVKNGVTALPEISEKQEESVQDVSEVEEINEISESVLEEESLKENVLEEEEEVSELDSEIEESSQIEENGQTEEISQIEENSEFEEKSEIEENSEIQENYGMKETSQIESSEATDNHDEIINKVLEDHDISVDEENKILDGILSNGDTSESMDER